MSQKINYKKSLNSWNEISVTHGAYSGFKIKDMKMGQYRLDWETKYLSNIIDKYFTRNKNNLKILDVGCATGNFIDFFKEYGSVVGIDFSKNYIDFCRKRFKHNENIKLYNNNVLDFYSGKRFNLIFVGGVLMYLNSGDLNKAVGNLKKILDNDSIIIFREGTSLDETLIDELVFRRTVKEYIKTFKNNGLNILKIDQNIAYFYPTFAILYKMCFKLNIFKTKLFKIKIFEYVLFRIPLKIMIVFRKIIFKVFRHIIVNDHFFVCKK